MAEVWIQCGLCDAVWDGNKEDHICDQEEPGSNSQLQVLKQIASALDRIAKELEGKT